MNSDHSDTVFSEEVATFLYERLSASHILSIDTMQNVWGGQGKLLRLTSNSSQHPTSVLKLISLDREAIHPRGWNGQNSHERKAHSYIVERQWYEHYAKSCNAACRVPSTIGVQGNDNGSLILLEDLSPEFPLCCSQLTISEVCVCLKWLAEFHGKFLGNSGQGLWDEGCYWHLATRPDEFEAMAPGPVKNAAKLLDKKLKRARFQTLVHGDAKVANFCFNRNKTDVAAVDFQYVGRGCGMKDVVYFLGSCLTETQCAEYEEQLLEFYFDSLKSAVGEPIDDSLWPELEKEWRGLYPVAWTDFYRFLLGWMPTHAKINSYTLSLCERSLSEL